jgi:hypothetical protein
VGVSEVGGKVVKECSERWWRAKNRNVGMRSLGIGNEFLDETKL